MRQDVSRGYWGSFPGDVTLTHELVSLEKTPTREERGSVSLTDSGHTSLRAVEPTLGAVRDNGGR